MDDELKKKGICSRHIFCLPVQLDLQGKLRRSENYLDRLCRRKEFRVQDGQGTIRLNGGWKRIGDWEGGNGNARNELERERYMLWQYLSHQSRGIFTDLDSERKNGHSACHILRFELDPKKANTFTLVRAADKGKKLEEKEFTLGLKKLEYHVYCFGCGVLLMDTEQIGEIVPGDRASADAWIADAKWVADRGRRLRLPFFPDEPGGMILTAESMTLTINGTAFSTSFREQAKAFCEGKAVSEKDNLVLELFQELLSGGIIKPLLPSDDRLFELELLRYPEGMVSLHRWREEPKVREQIYAVLHMDDGDPSCQDAEMLASILKKEVNPRWSGYGTLHGATSYSFVCMVNDNPGADASTVRPFLTEYPYMVSLALAQRTCLAQYSEQAGNILRSVHIRKLFRLQDCFTRFQSTLLVPEFTNQEQGIELYRMLQKAMLIDDERELLQARLGERFEMVDTASELFLAVIAVVLAVVIPILQFCLPS